MLLKVSETHATTDISGTFGYVASEYAVTYIVSDKAEVFIIMEWCFWNYFPPLAKSLWNHHFLAMGIDSTSLLEHACLLTKAENMRFSPLAYGTQGLMKI
jgi:hypothetical protein